MFLGVAGLVVGGWNATRYFGDPSEAKQDVLQMIEESRKRGLGPPALADPAEQEQADNDQAEQMARSLRMLIPLFTVVSGLVFYGGLAMALRRHYRMAQVGCILAMVNIAYGCCIPGLAVGAWGLLMLNSAEARAHFGK
jgi:enoyl-CoA hydratase/carnithine racemase